MRAGLVFVAVIAMLGRFAAAATDPPFTYTRADNETIVAADGSSVNEAHVVIRANNAGAAQALAQQVMAYSESLQSIEIVEAASIKPDGTSLKVDLAGVLTQLQPGLANLPMYGDLKRKVVIFPGVNAGDSISLTIRTRTLQPLFPGRYAFARTYLRTGAIESSHNVVRTPAAMPLAVEAHEVTVTTEQAPDGGTRVPMGLRRRSDDPGPRCSAADRPRAARVPVFVRGMG